MDKKAPAERPRIAPQVRMNGSSTEREGGLGGMKLFEAEVAGAEIVLQFGNAVLHIGAPVVIAPDLARPHAVNFGIQAERNVP